MSFPYRFCLIFTNPLLILLCLLWSLGFASAAQSSHECITPLDAPILLGVIVLTILATVCTIYCVMPHIPFLAKFSPSSLTAGNSANGSGSPIPTNTLFHPQPAPTSTPLMPEEADHFASKEIAFEELEPNFKQLGAGVYLNANELPVRWMAYEVLQNTERIKYSIYADLWACGVCMWEIFANGAAPYAELDNEAVIKHVLAGNKLPRTKHCPENIYDMLKQFWAKEKRSRRGLAVTKVYLQQLIDTETGNTLLSVADKAKISDAKSIRSSNENYL
ncbi:hypothetical protein WR25_03725 [Diploscapter pachys]|uniref:Tyrosine-protein kinase catalytic domain-containing protein n=1 Tax=Diploscapter pachys TaxID=2018661 RepID=A0A2A2LPA1_9BILA|nr:hypothetical protein WR25_03725 [Diploscapter pachys]